MDGDISVHGLQQIAKMRREYSKSVLDVDVVDLNPLSQFQKWMDEENEKWKGTLGFEINGMTLSTCNIETGRPSSRVVLLKHVDAQEGSFWFFTNYTSRKGGELDANPWAALNFWWDERQIRIEGKVTKVSAKDSETYFASRPRGSQIGAWSSPNQSKPVESRKALDEASKTVEKQFENAAEIPKPDFWGGYKVVADRIEFWQGRASRMHDRLVYSRPDFQTHLWKIERLSP